MEKQNDQNKPVINIKVSEDSFQVRWNCKILCRVGRDDDSFSAVEKVLKSLDFEVQVE